MNCGLIFDFDGVIADSEALANTILAEFVSTLGLPTTLNDALNRYAGKRWTEIIAAIQDGIGGKLPDDFSEDLKSATLRRFREELREVKGATAFINQFRELPRCIASSSSIDRIVLCLELLGLTQEFGRNVLSADMVARGKPFPDIFLLAAERIDVPPSACLVIEDSANGIRAGVAAGMKVIGLCAGAHSQPGHAERLKAAGASHTAATWDEVSILVTAILKS